MRDFNMVSPALWRSRRFVNLPNDDSRLAFLYLLTNQHQTSAGCYRLIPGYACADLGGWTIERYAAAIGALVAADMVQVDPDTSEVLIRRWFQHSPPMNPKHHLGTARLISQLESEAIKTAAAAALNAAWAIVQAQQAAKAAQAGAGNVSRLLQPRR